MASGFFGNYIAVLIYFSVQPTDRMVEGIAKMFFLISVTLILKTNYLRFKNKYITSGMN